MSPAPELASRTELTLGDVVIEYVLDRIRRSLWFSAEDLDYIPALSSKHTDGLFDQLSAEQESKLLGLLRDRKEQLTVMLRQASTSPECSDVSTTNS